jgi:hypothetical protein
MREYKIKLQILHIIVKIYTRSKFEYNGDFLYLQLIIL